MAGVYASATPRYVVQYGQDPTDADLYGRVIRKRSATRPTASAARTSIFIRPAACPPSC